MAQDNQMEAEAAQPAVEVNQDTTAAPAAVDPYATVAISANVREHSVEESGSIFKRALTSFRKSVHSTMRYARICAELSILHFEQHGDLVYCQALLDAMPKNFVRRVAYLKWLAKFSPVTMEKGKLLKDKGDKAVKFDTEKALEVPFWDFSPDPEQIMWGETDVVKALKSAIRKFSGDTYTPKDDKAKAKLVAATTAVEKLG